jgi:hypothetical protein
MNPDLSNISPYLVLAYGITWDDRAKPWLPQDYYLLDYQAYQRPDQLTQEAMEKIAHDLLRARFKFDATSLKLKVIEA